MRHNFLAQQKQIPENKCSYFEHVKEALGTAQQVDENSSLKEGRRTESYTIEDAVELVSFISVSWLSKIAIVM